MQNKIALVMIQEVVEGKGADEVVNAYEDGENDGDPRFSINHTECSGEGKVG